MNIVLFIGYCASYYPLLDSQIGYYETIDNMSLYAKILFLVSRYLGL